MYSSSSTAGAGFEMNPYESFMRKHLKHYGYYTAGQNESFKSSRLTLSDWDMGGSFSPSGHITASDTEYENRAIKETKFNKAFQKLNSTIASLSAFPSWEEMFYNRFTDGNKRTTQLVFSHSAGKLVPKLREPRNLYALSKEPGAQQAPRWPAEMEVLPGFISFIPGVPEEREPFYRPTGFEKMPMSPLDGEGRMVYFNPPSKDAYFLRSRVGGSRKGCLPRAWMPKSPDDRTLVFESRFESGNLMRAVQRSEFEYDLQLRYDLYTDKHTQWFYFRVQNVRRNIKYRFTITNFMKPGSLYNCGMKPLMYSEGEARGKNIGWRRVGEEIKYYKNDMRQNDVKGNRSYYSLTWTCYFQHDGDTCYFAHCYPYTYSDLQEYLLHLSNDPVRSKFCKQRVLCRSLAGNLVYILTITSAARNPEDAKRKRAVVLTARVHPGETNSSWMMKGFLDFLTGDTSDAKLLRDTFVFKVVPMLNPDGVIVGNYRCSLAGRDLNRNYRSVLRDSFPSVSNTKAMIKKLMQEREVIVYCDLHGHSRKQNVFIYGCENKRNKRIRFRERVFPIILGRNAPGKFHIPGCKYKVQKNKEGTGRVVMWQMGILNSYTMEATFCGSTLGDNRYHHFRTVDYEAMGYHFCDSLLDYCDPDQTKCEEIYQELEEKLKEEILNHLERKGTPLPDGDTVDLNQDYTSGVESSTTGSDSSADDGLPVHLLALAPKLTKKKKLKSRKERDRKRNSLEGTKNQSNRGSGTRKTAKSGNSKNEAKNQENKQANEESKPKTPTNTLPLKNTAVWEDRKKVDQKLKYKHVSRQTVHSAGRAKHIQNRSGDGLPVYARDRCQAKALHRTDYLERLTSAYLLSGVMKSSSEDVQPFRYSSSGLPLAHLEGLCPHHEKAFTDSYVANQLSGLTFEDDGSSWNQPQRECRPPTVVQDVRSATPSSKSTQFNLTNMSSMRSQSQSPPHLRPLPLDEYIRPTSKQGMTCPSFHQTNATAVRRSTSRGPPLEEQIDEEPHPRPSSYADFVLREAEKPTMLDPQQRHSLSSVYGLDEQQGTPAAPEMSPSNTPGPATRPPSEHRRDRLITTPVFIESSREAPMYRDVNPGTVSILRAHNTPVKVVSGSSPAERGQSPPRSLIAARKPNKELISPSPPQILEEAAQQKNKEFSPSASFRSKFGARLTKEEPRSHRCTVEATPVSDPRNFAKQASQSSHHFKPSRPLYCTPKLEMQPPHPTQGENSTLPARQGVVEANPTTGGYRIRRSTNFVRNLAASGNKNVNNNSEGYRDGSVSRLYLRQMMEAELGDDSKGISVDRSKNRLNQLDPNLLESLTADRSKGDIEGADMADIKQTEMMTLSGSMLAERKNIGAATNDLSSGRNNVPDSDYQTGSGIGQMGKKENQGRFRGMSERDQLHNLMDASACREDDPFASISSFVINRAISGTTGQMFSSGDGRGLEGTDRTDAADRDDLSSSLTRLSDIDVNLSPHRSPRRLGMSLSRLSGRNQGEKISDEFTQEVGGHEAGSSESRAEWEAIPLRASTQYLTLSKLPGRLGQRRNPEARYYQERRGERETAVATEPRKMKDEVDDGFDFIKSESMRLHKPVTHKMVAVVSPMTHNGSPVSH